MELGGPGPPNRGAQRLLDLSGQFAGVRAQGAMLEYELEAVEHGVSTVISQHELDPRESLPAALMLVRGLARGLVEDREVSIVIVDESLAPRGPTRLSGDRSARQVVGRVLEVSDRDDLYLWGVPRIDLQQGPGDRVRSALSGTLGTRVRTAAGPAGILTAGHVAGHVGARALTPAGVQFGTVTACKHAGNVGRGEITADVALVSPTTAVQVRDRMVWPRTLATTNSGDTVQVHKPTGQAHTKLVMDIVVLAVEAQPGLLGSLWATERCVTTAGDSGAPVLDYGNQGLVGHVLAKWDGLATIIQKAGFQLEQLRVRL
jgi:hypothetical protein